MIIVFFDYFHIKTLLYPIISLTLSIFTYLIHNMDLLVEKSRAFLARNKIVLINAGVQDDSAGIHADNNGIQINSSRI